MWLTHPHFPRYTTKYEVNPATAAAAATAGHWPHSASNTNVRKSRFRYY